MKNFFDQFDEQSSSASQANYFDQFDQHEPQQPVNGPEPAAASMTRAGEVISDMFTGNGRHTFREQNLPLVADAPEVNFGYGDDKFTLKGLGNAFKASAGMTFGLSDDSRANSIVANIPNSSFSNDAKGNKIIHLPSGDYVLSRAGFDMSDVPQIVGNVALGEIFAPARGATLANQVVGNLAATGAQAGLSQSVGGDESMADIGMDLAFGAGLPIVGDSAKFAYRWGKNGVSAEREAAEAVIRGAKNYDPNATVLTSDIFQPKTRLGKQALDIADNVPIIGTGGLRAKQQEERKLAAKNFITDISDDVDHINTQLNRDLQENLTAQKSRITDEYNQSSDVLATMGDFEPTNTISAIDEQLAKLTNPKVMPDKKTINYLLELRDTVSHPDGLNFGELKQNRTHLSAEINGIHKGAAQHLGSQASGALKQVRSAMGEDLVSFAENTDPELGMRWLKANESYSQFAGDTKGSLGATLNAIDSGKEEKVLAMLTTGDIGTAKQVYRNLTPEAQEVARRGILNKIIENNKVSPNELSTVLSKDKIQRRIKAFFPEAEKANIDDLLTYLNTSPYAQTATGNIKTGYSVLQNVPMLSALSGNAGAMAASIAGGLGGRIYQSPLVRDAKIRASGFAGDAVTNAIPAVLRQLNNAQRADAFQLKDDPLYQGAVLSNPNYRNR